MPTGCAQDESDKKCGKWECSTQCKPLTVFEVDASHCFFKASFGLPAEKVGQVTPLPVTMVNCVLNSLGPSKFGHNSFIFHPILK